MHISKLPVTRAARLHNALAIAGTRRYEVDIDEPTAIDIRIRRTSWEETNIAARQLETALTERGYLVGRHSPIQIGGGVSDADQPHEVLVTINLGIAEA